MEQHTGLSCSWRSENRGGGQGGGVLCVGAPFFLFSCFFAPSLSYRAVYRCPYHLAFPFFVNFCHFALVADRIPAPPRFALDDPGRTRRSCAAVDGAQADPSSRYPCPCPCPGGNRCARSGGHRRAGPRSHGPTHSRARGSHRRTGRSTYPKA